MTRNMTHLSRQWYTRPEHERFLSLEAQLHAARIQNDDMLRPLASGEQLLVSFKPEADTQGREAAGGPVYLGVPQVAGAAVPTYHAFGQIASEFGMQAGKARALPARLVAEEINFLKRDESQDLRFHLLPVRDQDGAQMTYPDGPMAGEKALSCIAQVSRGYGYVSNAFVVEQLIRLNDRHNGAWKVPAASYKDRDPRRATTLYMGTGDLFDCLVAEDLFEIEGRPVKVGIIATNSVIGTRKLGLQLFTYDFICDNRTIWGADLLADISIKHSSLAWERAKAEFGPALNRFAISAQDGRTVKMIEAKMKAAAETPVFIQEKGEKVRVDTPERASKWLTEQSYGEALAQAAVSTWVQEEGRVPTTLKDMADVATAGSRGVGDADARYDLDRLAGKWLGSVKVEPTLQVAVPAGFPSSNGRALAGSLSR